MNGAITYKPMYQSSDPQGEKKRNEQNGDVKYRPWNTGEIYWHNAISVSEVNLPQRQTNCNTES